MLPVVQRIMEATKEGTEPIPMEQLASFTKKHILGSYSSDELGTEFLKLCNYEMTAILGLSLCEDTLENRRLATHCAILQANDTGAPAGDQLVPLQATSSSANEEGNVEPQRGVKRVSLLAILGFVCYLPGIQYKHCKHANSC